MLTSQQKELIKNTVPVLKEHGVLLTSHFYQRMFLHNPELKNVFNMGNQQKGNQQTALALAVLAYAENIDDTKVLAPVLEKIAQKHTSLDIRPEHYSIVGNNLIASIKEVLGEAATTELLLAWSIAYAQLADMLIVHEQDLYKMSIAKEGGWTGWRPFMIRQKVQESAEITSFYLYPTDGGQVADFIPGQYISIKLFIPEIHLFQPRQYSISCAPNTDYYRISIKKEPLKTSGPAGMVSNRMHDHVREGDVIMVSAPAGDFTIELSKTTPVVFISGGVGLTPLMSMIEALIKSGKNRHIVWIHGCRNNQVHAFRESLSQWSVNYERLKSLIFYDSVQDCTTNDAFEGVVDISRFKKDLIIENADYYLCGPSPFIKKQYYDLINLGIKNDCIHYEEFGPNVLQLN